MSVLNFSICIFEYITGSLMYVNNSPDVTDIVQSLDVGVFPLQQMMIQYTQENVYDESWNGEPPEE